MAMAFQLWIPKLSCTEGFTIPVFVATLSFEGVAELLTEVKASIMLASSIAGLAGDGSLLLVLNKRGLS